MQDDINPGVRSIRERLVKAREAYKEMETARNYLLKSMYLDGTYTVEELMYQFGMTEANVLKTIKGD